MRAAVVEALKQPLVVREVPDPECSPDGVIVRVGVNIAGVATGAAYIPHMSTTITREFLSANQARKARSGTPSSSRI